MKSLRIVSTLILSLLALGGMDLVWIYHPSDFMKLVPYSPFVGLYCTATTPLSFYNVLPVGSGCVAFLEVLSKSGPLFGPLNTFVSCLIIFLLLLNLIYCVFTLYQKEVNKID
jgi:hypothetical protein